MVEMLNKLEFMLMGLRQMNLSSVCAWFPKDRREDIIEAINNSSKFKLEDGIVTLKSETERYEEELQKDILKDLMGDDSSEIGNMLEDDDGFSSYDDDLELLEDVVIEEENIQDAQIVNEIQDLEPTIVENDFVEVEHVEVENIIEEVQAVEIETEPASKEQYTPSYSNSKGNTVVKEKVVLKEEVEEKVQAPVNVNSLDGATLSYETILKLISEYNNSVEGQLNYAVENRYEVRERAIKTFYNNKYNVRMKEEAVVSSAANIYGLVHKKKGMEVAYLVICEILNDSILNYVLDNYDDEVVYFCPIDGVDVDFEVGLNEFYLKDTDIIFDKYLEHYVIVEESDKKIKKMEVIVGNH
ncbi:MAG: hypothetical protein ACRC68_06180 [Clostridium sp.]